MKAGKAFEIFVRQILLQVGFSAVRSDGLYVFDAAPGQMIQGLGGAHNADVLLEPPVQTPFYSLSRLLVECKDYTRKVGLDTIRSALGLKEDLNHFDIVDRDELLERRNMHRNAFPAFVERYDYQVAVASMSGFTAQAQKFAAAYRIPLIEFTHMPYWNEFCRLLDPHDGRWQSDGELQDAIENLVWDIGQWMAVAVTNSGQLLFLYSEAPINFTEDQYTLHWSRRDMPWELRCGGNRFLFQLPQAILQCWLAKSKDELDLKIEALYRKTEDMSRMVVYYRHRGAPKIKMLSINKDSLEEAMQRLTGRPGTQ